jgi:hypothetical protein
VEIKLEIYAKLENGTYTGDESTEIWEEEY